MLAMEHMPGGLNDMKNQHILLFLQDNLGLAGLYCL